MPQTLTHRAQTDRPARDDTVLYAQCGTAYARRDPATREVWHEALAIAPSQAATFRQVWGHRWTLCPDCWSD
jgi:hypothetical protein